MSRAYMLEHGQKKTSAGSAYPSARQGTSNPAAEALRQQREIFKREQQAAPVSTPSPPAATQNPQFKRYELKEKQMNRQDSAARQAAPRWDIGSVAANATLDYLNQSGVSTKYTQDIAQTAPKQTAPKQTAPKQSASGWNLKNVAADATLGYLNQNGVSTKYTQDIARTAPKQLMQKQAMGKTSTGQTDTKVYGISEGKYTARQEVPERSEEQIQRELEQAVRNWEGINPGYAVTPEQAESMEIAKKQAWEQVSRLREEQKLLAGQQKRYAEAAENYIKQHEQAYIQKYAGRANLRQSVEQLTAQLDRTTDSRAKAQLQAEIDWLKPYADYQWNINYDVDGAKARIAELDEQIARKQGEYWMLSAGGSSTSMRAGMTEAIKSLEAERNRLYQESYFAELIQTDASYRELMASPDFAEYSRIGAAKQNHLYDGLWDSLSGIDMSYYEMANPAKAMREEKTGNDTSYLYMTEEEYSIYNYLLAKTGKVGAEHYHKSIMEILNAREGQRIGENIRGIDSDVLRVLATGGYGLVAGVDQFGIGIAQNFSRDRLPASSIQYGSGYIRNDLGSTGPKIVGDNSFGQLLYDTTTTVGNMAPSILLSSLAGGLGIAASGAQAMGAGAMGLSARGNAYNQALAQGYSPEQAGNYATMIGVSEAALQYLLGGIGKLGGKLTGKMAATVTNIDNALLRASAELGIKDLGEMGEEYLQAIFEPAYRNLILDEHNEIRLVSEEAVYSAIMALMTTSVFEGRSTTTNTEYGSYFPIDNGHNNLLLPANYGGMSNSVKENSTKALDFLTQGKTNSILNELTDAYNNYLASVFYGNLSMRSPLLLASGNEINANAYSSPVVGPEIRAMNDGVYFEGH